MSASSRTLGLSVPVTACLSPELWRERYAYGLNLGPSRRATVQERVAAAKRGEPANPIDAIPDDVIKWHLRAALSELEMKLGIPMGIEVVKSLPLDDGLRQGIDYDRVRPRLPYTRSETETWFRVDLPDMSIISVERIRAYYFRRLIWEFSESKGTMGQVHLEWPKQGVLHIVPTELQAVIVTQNGGNYGVWETINSQATPVPDFWAVDYTTGPKSRDGKVGHVEAVLAHWVYCAAGILLLSMGGLAQSKGLTNTSISMDGVSRSIGLQASAIYGINSALEKAYETTMKRIDWNKIRTNKLGLRVRQFGA